MSDKPSLSQQAQGDYIAQATQGGTATVNVVLPPQPVQEQNRVRFLKRLRYRYNEVWEQSLEGAALMTLGLTSKPDAVQHHTEFLLLSPQQPERPLPQGTSIAQVYEQATQELLILGEPGAGKSTLLLELARQLVEHAEQDAAQPFPVIIPLSTWSVKRQPLPDWLSEQLTQLYNVPRRLSDIWVQTDQILPLLDGLDEVPQEARVACIQAINTYHKEHLVPLVVCSRHVEYEEIPRQQRLLMQSAVVVQPLTQEQVQGYLLQGGKALTPVRTVLHTNPVLQELITTPLMLHLLMLTYADAKASDLPQGGSPEEQQQIIFARYTELMIERKKIQISFPLQRIIPWLSWLARQMRQHNQTIFYIEHLQPDWLTGDRMFRVYDWWAVRFPGVLMGALVCLTISVCISAHIAFPPWGSVSAILLGGLLGGLLSEGSIPRRTTGSGGKARSALGPRLLQWLLIGGLVGLLVGRGYRLGYMLGDWQGFRSPFDLSTGLIYGLSIGICSILLQFLLGKNNTTEARSRIPPPAKGTIWKRFIKRREVHNGLLVGLSVGLSVGLIIGLTSGLSNRLISGLLVGLSFGLASGLIYGLSAVILSILLIGRSTAVQPTDLLVWSWRSLGKSLFSKSHASTTLRVTELIGLSFGLSYELIFVPISVQGSVPNHWLSSALRDGLAFGLASGLSTGLSCWLLLGLFQGVSSATIEDQRRIVPNQGIHRSALNGLVFGLISAVIIGLSYPLGYGLGYMLSDWLYIEPAYGLAFGHGLAFGLSIGLETGLSTAPPTVLLVGLLIGLFYGGLACLRHYVLRFLLWRTGSIPWHYAHFLDFAAKRILLRKVGGGYIFIHRLLLDYFADLEPTALTAAATQPPTGMKVP